MGRRKSVVTANQAVMAPISVAKVAKAAAPITPKTDAVKTPLVAPKLPGLKSPLAAPKSPLGGGGISQNGGIAPTKSRMTTNRSSIGVTPKATATIKTVQAKADPTAKSYTDDIYEKFEGKAAKKAGKPSYR